MDTPITRKEQYLAKIAGEDVPLPAPETREEQYLAKIAGEDVTIPEKPETREEQYLAAIVEGGGVVEVESLSVTENGTYTAEEGKAYSPVSVAVENSYAAGDEGKVVSNGALVAQTSDSVTENGTVDTTLINSLTVNVPQGGGGWELIGEWEETISTTSTSLTTVAQKTVSPSLDGAWMYVTTAHDKAGKQAGCFVASFNYQMPTSTSYNNLYAFEKAFNADADGYLRTYTQTYANTAYGVYGSIYDASTLKIFARYDSNYSKTINSTYVIRLYKVPYPANCDPRNFSFE